MGCKKLTYNNFETTLKVVYGTNLGAKKLGVNYSPFGTEQSGRHGGVSGDYGYQGSLKEDGISGEGNHYTTEFRELDPRIGRWWSPDPVFQPWQSPYNSMDNNPISLNDPLGNVAGDYYGTDGQWLGTDGKNDNKAYVVTEVVKKDIKETTDQGRTVVIGQKLDTEKSTKQLLSITNTELLNRANWAYGEGGGEYLDHYAHTINNLKAHGKSGRKPFASDEEMFKTKMTHKAGKTIINMYPGYFNGTAGSPSAKKFAKARGQLNTLTNDKTMRAAIGAIIGSITGTTEDPTNGAYQWVGGSGSAGGVANYPEQNNAKNVTNVTSGTGDGMRYHTFYEHINP